MVGKFCSLKGILQSVKQTPWACFENVQRVRVNSVV
jgi:hypothetical protein